MTLTAFLSANCNDPTIALIMFLPFRAMELEDEVRNLGNNLSKLEADHKRAQQELMDMVPEMDQLKARLDDAKRALDKEQLKSSGLENKCASLEEDLKFQLSLLEKELTEVK